MLRCGAGHSGYTITTDSKIVACPIMNNIQDFKAGTLEDSPMDLKEFTIILVAAALVMSSPGPKFPVSSFAFAWSAGLFIYAYDMIKNNK